MANEHIVKSFDNELDRMETIIAEMGGVAEQQLVKAATPNWRSRLSPAMICSTGWNSISITRLWAC